MIRSPQKLMSPLAFAGLTALAAVYALPANQPAASPVTMENRAAAPPGSAVKPQTPVTPSSQVVVSSAFWSPAINTTWQWQLDKSIDQTVAATVFDIDLFENDASVVAALHRRHRKVICYLSAGSWEKWRPDASQFPAQVIGRNYSGWPDEKWLDIRQIDLLAPMMRARFDQCKAKGFDAIEPDNIDGYTNNTGFPLTAQDQLKYNRWLAAEAHARGLSIGLKNDADQVPELLPYFDWALTEDCFDQGWCEQLVPFVRAGKAVFSAEYTDTGITLDQFCQQASELNFNAILKRRNLDAWRQSCSAENRRAAGANAWTGKRP